VRDTNTLLDESGVVIPCADSELAELLRDFRWKELFWQRRERVQNSMGIYLFGHGLYEKALRPYIGMTGQGLLLPVAQGSSAGRWCNGWHIWMIGWQDICPLQSMDAAPVNFLRCLCLACRDGLRKPV